MNLRIFVDGKEIDFNGTTVGDLPRPDGALYALVNGRHVDDGRPLKDEDNIVFVRKNSPLESCHIYRSIYGYKRAFCTDK